MNDARRRLSEVKYGEDEAEFKKKRTNVTGWSKRFEVRQSGGDSIPAIFTWLSLRKSAADCRPRVTIKSGIFERPLTFKGKETARILTKSRQPKGTHARTPVWIRNVLDIESYFPSVVIFVVVTYVGQNR